MDENSENIISIEIIGAYNGVSKNTTLPIGTKVDVFVFDVEYIDPRFGRIREIQAGIVKNKFDSYFPHFAKEYFKEIEVCSRDEAIFAIQRNLEWCYPRKLEE